MTIESYYTLGVLIVLVAALMSRRMGSDIAFLCALTALLVPGILKPAEAVKGFANPAVITVALLYIVAQGLKETGGMTTVTRRLLGRPTSLASAQGRLLVPVAGLSAFVNNTPIVAMFLPVLDGWATRSNLNASRLFMPLSFAAMLGGVCTLIGTSTNLVVNELIIETADMVGASAAASSGLEQFSMFTLAWIGVPIVLVGLVYMLVFGRSMLPSREAPTDDFDDESREFALWMRVRDKGAMADRTIEGAGLRHLSGLYLSTIDRDGRMIVAPGPQQVLEAGDRLEFVGDVESVVELQQMAGLEPDTEQITKLDSPRFKRRLVEAVISESSPLVGKSVRDGEFRTRFNAVIIAVHRAGERVRGKIGDIVLRSGDTLLLEASPGFASLYRNSTSFYLVSEREDQATPNWGKAWLALAILAALVATISLGILDVMTAAIAAAMAMVVSRCCTGTQARRSVDWQVIVVIGSAFGIAHAMETTGVARVLANSVLHWTSGMGTYGMLAGVYLLTVGLTSVMTNNAAAALVFPITYQFASHAGQDFMPYAVCIAVGASSAFLTPIGYQTNMMVMGPGGYGWTDFLRFGGPLTILIGIVCVLLAPVLYG